MRTANFNRAKVNPAELQLPKGDSRLGAIFPALILVGLALVGAIAWLVMSGEGKGMSAEIYLLPWLALTTLVVAAPSVILLYQGKFNFFHPLVHAAWSYFVPAFVVGGFILAFGISQPVFMHFIKNPATDLPWTFVYITLGFAGLTAGFYLPFGKWAGERLQKNTPLWDWQSGEMLMPGVILLILGSFGTAVAFASGVLGYQKAQEWGAYDGIIYLTSLFLMQASFLLWMAIFRAQKLNFTHFAIIGLLLFFTLTRAAFAGNRSSLVHAFIAVFAAYILSGRQFKFKQGVIAGVVLVVVLLMGMIYGTTFRHLKETQAQVSFTEYIEYIPRTFDTLGRQDTGAVIGQGFQALADRLENVSSVAVVVSNYEDLQPYEASYGMDNNIWKDLVTFLVPRVLWKDKPLASDPSKYGDLYFNYSENSFTITPMGDLLRNFGPWGVPLGMLILGLILRFFYAALIENQTVTFWRASVYFMLMFTVSYESFYGILIPYLARVGVFSIIGVLIIWFLMPRKQINLSS